MESMTLETRLAQGALDETLARLYGANRLEEARARCAGVLSGFAKTFESLPEALFSAPGRTEVGGNHTDHQHGRVLAASVDLDILAAAAPNQSGMIRVQSQGYPLIVVDLRELAPKPEEENTSAALIRGVAARFAALGCPLQSAGLDAYLVSSVPGGSGLSSSAAFEVLIGTMLNDLFWDGKCTPVEIAQIGQYAENVFFGKPCGLMDQTASSVGGVVAIDFADTAHPAVEQISLDLAANQYAMCILDSGAGHADLTAEYAAITDELKAVCRYFGKEVLRDVPEESFLAALPQVRKAAGDRAVNRAFHIYAENRRGPGPAGRQFRGVPPPGAGVRQFLRPVPAKCHPHRPDRQPGADADHRPVRAHPERPGCRPRPRRRLRRHGPGLCAAGDAGGVPVPDRGRSGRGQLPCGDHPARWRRPAGVRRAEI